ncbi:hypothetical protein AVEN_169329-1 [Araneus ventricosus]|uniref:Uncharacterized protein n=1 Tax=Araneus ventricosus TaxID=182803 RepID=A0A4Y2RZB4_ARAVE|nr:hypothetical protein AVEN_169329-1 [Araneus ventricosus]
MSLPKIENSSPCALHSLAEFKAPDQRFVHINIDIIIGLLPSIARIHLLPTAIDSSPDGSKAMSLADIRRYHGSSPRLDILIRSSFSGSPQTERVHNAGVMFHLLAKPWNTSLSLCHYPQATIPERGTLILKERYYRHTSVHCVSVFHTILTSYLQQRFPVPPA